MKAICYFVVLWIHYWYCEKSHDKLVYHMIRYTLTIDWCTIVMIKNAVITVVFIDAITYPHSYNYKKVLTNNVLSYNVATLKPAPDLSMSREGGTP